jgi:hypothetical protein
MGFLMGFLLGLTAVGLQSPIKIQLLVNKMLMKNNIMLVVSMPIMYIYIYIHCMCIYIYIHVLVGDHPEYGWIYSISVYSTAPTRLCLKIYGCHTDQFLIWGHSYQTCRCYLVYMLSIYISNYINIIYPPDKKSAEKSWSFGCVDAFPDDSSRFQGITPGQFSDFQDQMITPLFMRLVTVVATSLDNG